MAILLIVGIAAFVVCFALIQYMLADTISSTYAQEGENFETKPMKKDSLTVSELGKLSWTNNDNDTLSVSTETNRPISGNASLRVDIKPAATVEELTNSSWSVISTDFIPVNRSGYHDYGLDVSAKDVNQLHSKLYHYDSNKKEISSDFIFGGRDGTFKQGFDNTVLSPAAAKYMKLQMWVKPSVGKNASYLVDNIQFSYPKEVYAWTNGSPMPNPRFEISTEVLNERVYVVGGVTADGTLMDTVEVYDPQDDKWSTSAPMPAPRDHTGMSSYNGKLYLVGGFMEHRIATNTLFIYDPINDTWKVGPPMPTSRAGLSADFIDGILYAVGGSTGDNEGALQTNEAYDPVKNEWTKKSDMPTARHHHTSAVVHDRLFIIGGRETYVPSSLDKNEMYDTARDKWIIQKPMPTKRSGLAAATLNNNIFVIGGEKESGSFDINEKYNVETDNWTTEPPMPTNRLGHDAVEVNNKIYVIGGKTSQPGDSITGVNEILYAKTADMK